jgi:hypothetical protein
MVADPRRGATLAHHVPARLVLAVVMAAADREIVLAQMICERVSKPQAAKWLTENELSDLSRLWHDGCVKATIETQDVDRNHSSEV